MFHVLQLDHFTIQHSAKRRRLKKFEARATPITRSTLRGITASFFHHSDTARALIRFLHSVSPSRLIIFSEFIVQERVRRNQI
jgi:hypothetical protein